ncbi:MAG TPA: hypothetical protein VG963_01110 [Polyangiaceae bacterium]|nr:hypothetical protein [Polyangiaceae bacterium]
MTEGSIEATRYHRVFGRRKPKITYFARDFSDYLLMNGLVALVVAAVFGAIHPMALIGMALCLLMTVAFPVRRGFKLAAPLILKRPQEIVYTLVYKVLNIRWELFLAVCLVLSEQAFIAFLPSLPHKVDLMRQVGLVFFYLSFTIVTLFRTRSLIDHLRKRDIVRAVLSDDTAWKATIATTGPTFEIIHAYASGLLSHITTTAPWYLVITLLDHSILFLPVGFVLSASLQRHFFTCREFRLWEKRKKQDPAKSGPRPEMFGTVASWFYRDHWVGHNSEFEFLYLHGTHHDSIPVGLIATGENGHLEGFLRYCFGYPTALLSPIWAFLELTFLFILNIGSHQYVPGIYPYSYWHSTGNVHFLHHFGRLVPYGVTTVGRPQIDMELNGYDPANARRKAWQALVDQYEHELRIRFPSRLFPPLRIYK